MGEIVVTESLTLDGVMQAPGRADEDPRGGFVHGGWAAPYADAVMGAEMAKGMTRPGVMLFGRRTYEALAEYWPKQTDGNPYTEKLNKVRKYVVSSTLVEPLPWMNSTVVPGGGDVPAAVAALRDATDGDIAVLGSGQLVRTLAAAGLVDRYVLLIHPLVLGTGLRLFDGAELGELRLTGSVTTGTGVIIATYEASRRTS
ncbi:dihydrofolate reductase [Catenulispora sp. GP43]|uniref:dihydrofolate reductase family protein n=1 Tax=Catenulispora sp. GP43 TaxID=3156263 RepID=UPI003513BCAF